MSVSYSKLWKMLIDKKMSKADLRKAAGRAPNTMTKLRRDEEVKLSILCRICAVLHVNFGDIIDFVPSDAEKEMMLPAFLNLLCGTTAEKCAQLVLLSQHLALLWTV